MPRLATNGPAIKCRLC